MNGLCIGGLELSRGQTDDRRQKTSQLAGTTCRTRDLAAGYYLTRLFLDSYCARIGSWQVREG
jgi:hypothetical protein